MDFLVLVIIIVAVAFAAGICSGGIAPWARGEWRLMRQHTWAPDPEAGPCTVEGDARAASMVVKQRALGKRLRREGRSILSAGREYTPVLTKPAPVVERPPKADKVVPIRRRPA